MAKTFRLEIVTPERLVLSEEVSSLVVPAEEGYLGVLAGHAPLLCTLKAGELRIRRESGAEAIYATSGGFLEAGPKKASILCESADSIAEIDIARAQEAKVRALERLRHTGKDIDWERAVAALERAENRLRIAKKHGKA